MIIQLIEKIINRLNANESDYWWQLYVALLHRFQCGVNVTVHLNCLLGLTEMAQVPWVHPRWMLFTNLGRRDAMNKYSKAQVENNQSVVHAANCTYKVLNQLISIQKPH